MQLIGINRDWACDNSLFLQCHRGKCAAGLPVRAGPRSHLALALVHVPTALAEEEHAGVVAALTGQASVVRTRAPEPAPLKFRDDVFVNDRIATAERSMARLLLGERALVTIREHSVLTITGVPGKAVADLTLGELLIAVVKKKMAAGDTIEIKTPNAVVAIRGTVVVAEVLPADGSGAADQSVISVLRGRVEIVQLDPASRRALGAPMMLDAMQSVVFKGMAAPVRRTLSQDTVRRMARRYKMPLGQTTSPMQAALVETQREKAMQQVDALLKGKPSDSAPATTSSGSGSGTRSASSSSGGSSSIGSGSSGEELGTSQSVGGLTSGAPAAAPSASTSSVGTLAIGETSVTPVATTVTSTVLKVPKFPKVPRIP